MGGSPSLSTSTSEGAPEPDSDDIPPLETLSESEAYELIDREISQFLDSDAEDLREPEAPGRLEPITWCPRPRRRRGQPWVISQTSGPGGFFLRENL